MAIEEIAAATEIQIRYLEAMEHSEFDALPGPSFGKFYIRAYAEVLGFNPRALIDEYDRERSALDPEQLEAESHRQPPDAWQIALRKSREEAQKAREEARKSRDDTPVALLVPEPIEPTGPVTVRGGPGIVLAPRQMALVVSLLSLVLVMLGAWVHASRSAADTADTDATSDTRPVLPASGPPAEPRQGLTQVASAEVVLRAAPADGVKPPPVFTVQDFGVGRRIVARRLEGRDERFEEGEVAWFSTRVLGAERGQTIYHVWLREGRQVQSIELELGGPHWRTHSRKTLWGVGSWTVEARDAADRVLARSSFTCVPRGP